MVRGISSCCKRISSYDVERRCQNGTAITTLVAKSGARAAISTSAINFGLHWLNGIYRNFRTLRDAGCASIFSPITLAMTTVSAVDTLSEGFFHKRHFLIRKAPGALALTAAALTFPLSLPALEAAKYYALLLVIDKAADTYVAYGNREFYVADRCNRRRADLPDFGNPYADEDFGLDSPQAGNGQPDLQTETDASQPQPTASAKMAVTKTATAAETIVSEAAQNQAVKRPEEPKRGEQEEKKTKNKDDGKDKKAEKSDKQEKPKKEKDQKKADDTDSTWEWQMPIRCCWRKIPKKKTALQKAANAAGKVANFFSFKSKKA